MRIAPWTLSLVFLIVAPDVSARDCKKLGADERVLFVGDSNTEAAFVGAPYRYPAVVSDRLGVSSRNVGLGGTVSADWVPWADAWTTRAVPNLPADAMVVMLGTNDAFRGVFVTEYAGNLFYLITQFAGDVYLLTPPPFLDFPWAISLLGAAVERLAATLQNVCGVIDTHEFLNIPDDYGDPGLHLNEQGHRKIADALIAEMGRHSTGKNGRVENGGNGGE